MEPKTVTFQEWDSDSHCRPSLATGGLGDTASAAPAEYARRLDELEEAFKSAAADALAETKVKRDRAWKKSEKYVQPDGSIREVNNKSYESSIKFALAEIFSEECATAIRELARGAVLWPDEAARAAGIDPVNAVYQDRSGPYVQFLNRGWSLMIGCSFRGRLMEMPIGEKLPHDIAMSDDEVLRSASAR